MDPEQQHTGEAQEIQGGFGTGLRASIERHGSRDGKGPKAPEVVAAVEAPPAPVAVASGDRSELEAELRRAIGREEELRQALAEQADAYERTWRTSATARAARSA